MEQRRPHDGYEEQFDDDEHEDENDGKNEDEREFLFTVTLGKKEGS